MDVFSGVDQHVLTLAALPFCHSVVGGSGGHRHVAEAGEEHQHVILNACGVEKFEVGILQPKMTI